MLNRAIGDADVFAKMLQKVQRIEDYQIQLIQALMTPEVTAWNAEVDRKHAEKKARKAQHTKALDGLR